MKTFAVIATISFIILATFDLQRAARRQHDDEVLAVNAYYAGLEDGSAITKAAFIQAIAASDNHQNPTVEINGRPDFKR